MDRSSELVQVKHEIATLMDAKSKLVAKKRDIELKQKLLKNRVVTKGILPRAEYLRITSDQSRLLAEVNKIEKELSPINSDLRRWNAILDGLSRRDEFADGSASMRASKSDAVDRGIDENIRSRIKELRQTYMLFAQDSTRVNSMRIMAAEFSERLTKIIGE